MQFDDLVGWVDNKDKTEIVFAAVKNSGDGKGVFTDMDDVHGAMYCDNGAGVFFLDMNGDGLDDFVCVDSKGNVDLAVNQGNGDRASGKAPSFKSVGRIKATETNARANVVLADIDGDGRGDYGVLAATGPITFWRNGGTGDKPAYWQAMGVRWTESTGSKGIRFRDLNGDVSQPLTSSAHTLLAYCSRDQTLTIT